MASGVIKKLVIRVFVLLISPGLVYLAAILYHEFSVEKQYNYAHFSTGQYEFDGRPLGGPEVGDQAIDFVVTDLQGRTVHLSDYRGKVVVLETGSVTCAQYASRITPMNSLMLQHPEVAFLMLYVREAHPGANFPVHRSFEQKLEHARQLAQIEPEKRTILVDNLQGSAHRAYGAWPNMIYVMGKQGVVKWRGKWNEAKATSQVLSQLESSDVSHIEPLFSPVDLGENMRILERAGDGALKDWILGIPGTGLGHLLEELSAEPE